MRTAQDIANDLLTLTRLDMPTGCRQIMLEAAAKLIVQDEDLAHVDAGITKLEALIKRQAA